MHWPNLSAEHVVAIASQVFRYLPMAGLWSNFPNATNVLEPVALRTNPGSSTGLYGCPCIDYAALRTGQQRNRWKASVALLPFRNTYLTIAAAVMD